MSSSPLPTSSPLLQTARQQTGSGPRWSLVSNEGRSGDLVHDQEPPRQGNSSRGKEASFPSDYRKPPLPLSPIRFDSQCRHCH